jgi:chemotaxis protein methyltransferase CheR
VAVPVAPQPGGELERIEIELLLEAIERHYGFDFRGYAFGSLRRRLWRSASEEGVQSISGLQEKILHDPQAMERLLTGLSVNVTTMFRDPTFYVAFREHVVPLLRTYPFIRFWNAGCSTGEETYSLAILLQEEGLYERARIYATDFNSDVLARARAGELPLDRMQEYTQNYQHAGGKRDFSAYYSVERGVAKLGEGLSEHAVFAQHNLASDRSFNEFNVVLCRNVLIYFGRDLQRRVHQLFYDSLSRFGVLGLGQKETLRFTDLEDRYEELDPRERIYRRIA